jgi:hypothetical protein
MCDECRSMSYLYVILNAIDKDFLDLRGILPPSTG